MVFVSDPFYEIRVFEENGTTYFSDGRNEVWMPGFSPLIRKRSKKITLKGSDGGVFEVDEAVALESEVIKHMIEGNCANDVIPLPIVSSYILSKVIEYCEKHVEMQKPGKDNNPLDEICLKCWDANFVKVDLPTLLGIQMAADYLNIRSLMELTYQTVLDMIKGMTFEELRKTFEIETDFSLEEEEEVTIKEKMGSKKVTLKSSDDQVFEVEAAVALESKTIKHMIENDCADGVIPLQNVTSEILSKVIEYCKKHVEMQKPVEDEDSDDSDWDDRIWEKRGDWVEWYLKCWDADFIKVNRTALRALFWAARYLKIKSLLDLTFQGAADLLNMVEGEEEERRVLQVIFF